MQESMTEPHLGPPQRPPNSLTLLQSPEALVQRSGLAITQSHSGNSLFLIQSGALLRWEGPGAESRVPGGILSSSKTVQSLLPMPEKGTVSPPPSKHLAPVFQGCHFPWKPNTIPCQAVGATGPPALAISWKGPCLSAAAVFCCCCCCFCANNPLGLQLISV